MKQPQDGRKPKSLAQVIEQALQAKLNNIPELRQMPEERSCEITLEALSGLTEKLKMRRDELRSKDTNDE